MKKLMKYVVHCYAVCMAVVNVYAQEDVGSGSQEDSKEINFILDDESKVSQELYGPVLSKSLYKVVLDTFERPTLWSVHMPDDQGLIVRRSVIGVPLPLAKEGPKEVKTIPEGKVPPRIRKADGTYETKYFVPYKDERKNILGVKVAFRKRGHNHFFMKPSYPVYVEGDVKAFEVWVAGRRKNHVLSVIVKDVRGIEHKIPFGKLNFFGWKRMRVNLPQSVIQYDHNISDKRGVTFKGLHVQCASLESQGEYYIYFDNLSAEVNRFWEEYQDQKDPVDLW